MSSLVLYTWKYKSTSKTVLAPYPSAADDPVIISIVDDVSVLVAFAADDPVIISIFILFSSVLLDII